jgi:AcrR family transcriptional regulator
MKSKTYRNLKIDNNPEAFFMAATSAFAKSGYRRTTMNDVAEAADMSRPALYQAFKNKEDVYCGMVSYLINKAVQVSVKTLSQSGPIEERFLAAMLDFEETYWGPMAKSQYALEIMHSTVKLKNTISAIKLGRRQLGAALSKSLQEAVRNGEVNFVDLGMQPLVFVNILMSVLAAKKYQDTSNPDYTDMPQYKFKRRNSKIIKIFLNSIVVRP